jgi:predicted Rossmann fold nucleotide-binding protein DprA/Smf involved in DNA uptake
MANAYYTGVGSRKCSHKDGLILTQIGMSMASKGIILRSGGAVGADTYFEMGCERWWDVSAADPLADIYVTEKRPRVWQHDWRKNVLILDEFPPEIVAEATELARNVHPNWGAMNDYGRSLHTRNAMQVLGSDLKTN